MMDAYLDKILSNYDGSPLMDAMLACHLKGRMLADEVVLFVMRIKSNRHNDAVIKRQDLAYHGREGNK